LAFKDDGASDFHITFERIKDRLHQAREAARNNNVIGNTSVQAGGSTVGININALNLDELPTYQDSRRDKIVPQPDPPELPSRTPIPIEDPAPAFEEVVEGRGASSKADYNPNRRTARIRGDTTAEYPIRT
jgi:hypothetical protein